MIAKLSRLRSLISRADLRHKSNYPRQGRSWPLREPDPAGHLPCSLLSLMLRIVLAYLRLCRDSLWLKGSAKASPLPCRSACGPRPTGYPREAFPFACVRPGVRLSSPTERFHRHRTSGGHPFPFGVSAVAYMEAVTVRVNLDRIAAMKSAILAGRVSPWT